jgi:hypothetical protein
MNKEEIPIEYYLTKNGKVVKFVRYDELYKYKQVIDKIKDICLENMYVDDRGGEPEKVERDIRPSKILELLEEIE